jgi:hypothetical protein
MIEVMDYNAKCSTEVLDDTTVDPLMEHCEACTATCSCGSGCDSSDVHMKRAYQYLKQHGPSGT